MSRSTLIDPIKLRLAAQFASRSWKSRMESIAASLEVHGDFDKAIASVKASPELTSILRASIELPDPTGFILTSLQDRFRTRQTWLKLLTSLAYPAVVLLLTVAMGLVFVRWTMSEDSFEFIKEFGISGVEIFLAQRQDFAQALQVIFWVLIWSVVTTAVTLAFAPAWYRMVLCGGLPLVGRPYRWLLIADVLSRIGNLIKHGGTLKSSLEIVGKSYGGHGLTWVLQNIERRVESGLSFSAAIDRSSLTDGLCRPFLSSLDDSNEGLSSSMLETGQILRTLAQARCQSLAVVMPVFGIIFAAGLMWGILNVYFSLLLIVVRLVSSLA